MIDGPNAIPSQNNTSPSIRLFLKIPNCERNCIGNCVSCMSSKYPRIRLKITHIASSWINDENRNVKIIAWTFDKFRNKRLLVYTCRCKKLCTGTFQSRANFAHWYEFHQSR